MKLQILYRSQAFGPGSKLWFIAHTEDSNGNTLRSPITNKIDWYLNFQLTRAHLHKPYTLSSELKSIVNENEMPEFVSPLHEPKPLFIVAKEQFPTQAIIEVPLKKESHEWPTQIFKIWQNLESPSIRVFLPQGFSADDFKTHWPKSAEAEMTLVPA